MEGPFFEVDGKDIYMAPFAVPLPYGYEPPVNAKGEVFPDCCPYHKGILTHVTQWFQKFPNCCPLHRQMAKGSNFHLRNYAGVPQKILQQVSYTEYHICKHIDDEDWYDDITDYLEFHIMSFGHPSVGSGLYFNNILRYIKRRKGIVKNKRLQLVAYMDAKQEKAEDRAPINLNLLYGIYQKWLKALPLELAIFKGKKEVLEQTMPILEDKPHYNRYTKEQTMPILEDKPHYNRYTKLSSAKPITPVKMVEALVSATETLLRSVDTQKLVADSVRPF